MTAMEAVPAEEIRDIYERSGLSVTQLARIFNLSRRSMATNIGGRGLLLRGWQLQQFRELRLAIGRAEYEATLKLGTVVASHSPKLPQEVAKILLNYVDGEGSPFGNLYRTALSNRVPRIQISDLELRKLAQKGYSELEGEESYGR